MTNRRTIIVLCLFALLVIVVPLTIIWPSIRTIEQTSHAILSEYQFLEQRQQRGLQTKRVRAEFEAAKQYSAGLQSLTLRNGREIDFITDLENLAVEFRVTQTLRLDLDNSTSKAGQPALPLTILIRGSYRDTVAYLHALRSLPTVISLETLRLVPVGDTASGQVSTSATGFIFKEKGS